MGRHREDKSETDGGNGTKYKPHDLGDLQIELNGDLFLRGEISSIKYMSSNNNYRVAFDIYEIDTHKVKSLIGKEQLPMNLIFVPEGNDVSQED